MAIRQSALKSANGAMHETGGKHCFRPDALHYLDYCTVMQAGPYRPALEDLGLEEKWNARHGAEGGAGQDWGCVHQAMNPLLGILNGG